jgi:hypothetical protein
LAGTVLGRDQPHHREQAVLGGLPLLTPAQRWLFQAGAACTKPAPQLKCTPWNPPFYW